MVKDSLQVAIANSSAIALNLTNCNEFLTFISLSLAIIYTIVKFTKIGKRRF
tara:strand:+ start:265 stop:420 length:156 start_codon:yes stop_codon:yes gene_type:complete